MSKINKNLVHALVGGPYDYRKLSEKPVRKTASEPNRGWSEQRKQFFRERLHHNITKAANESLKSPADLHAPDPHSEYTRRAQALDKTGEDIQPRDIVLGAQAFHTLMNHARREQKLKG